MWSSFSSENKRKFRLPKIELKNFDGNVKNWIGFWGQFLKIHEDKEIDFEDEFEYLLQATKVDSAERKLVESFIPSGANYMLAMNQMKARFAKDELLIEVYVRELLSLVLKQVIDIIGMWLSNLYNKLETQQRALSLHYRTIHWRYGKDISMQIKSIIFRIKIKQGKRKETVDYTQLHHYIQQVRRTQEQFSLESRFSLSSKIIFGWEKNHCQRKKKVVSFASNNIIVVNNKEHSWNV